jgi:methionyl aminopeptidase
MEWEGEELKKFEDAGKLAYEILSRSKALIKPGAKLLDVAESIEAEIRAKAGIAFPANISLNEEAAHRTPGNGDDIVFGDKDVVKLDIGAHIDGYIGDVACTVDLSGNNGKLVEASEAGLEAAIATVRAGVTTDEIGAAVEEAIKKKGFKPVENLTGHMLMPYELHGGLSIPNVKTGRGYELEEGFVLAIEPFASTGAGHVKEDRRTEIFAYEQDAPTRNKEAREILGYVKESYQTLPFAERWLARRWDSFKLKLALRELVTREAFHSYPILKDIPGSLVSQAEKTVIVEKEGCRILTKG